MSLDLDPYFTETRNVSCDMEPVETSPCSAGISIEHAQPLGNVVPNRRARKRGLEVEEGLRTRKGEDQSIVAAVTRHCVQERLSVVVAVTGLVDRNYALLCRYTTFKQTKKKNY